MAAAIAKVCKVCGTDVSAAKRTKNAVGEYFCQACTGRLRSDAAAPPPTPQPAPTTAMVSASSSSPPPDSSNRLQPGERDCFFDATMLGLLRRQVEPEELLAACDVRRPMSRFQRSMLLTQSRLVFIGVTNQAGQRMIADRRELPLEGIDNISVGLTRPMGIGRESFLIQIGSREGIESWVTPSVSGRRIAEAVQALKRGETIQPFVRRIEDMAEATAPALPAPGLNRGQSIRLPQWTDKLVLPPLRTSRSRLLVGILLAVALTGLTVGCLFGAVGLFLLLIGDFNDIGAILPMLVVGTGLVTLTLPNAYAAQGRLYTLKTGGTPIRPDTSPTTAPAEVLPRVPRAPIPWSILLQIVVPVLVLGGTGWWGYSYYESQTNIGLPSSHQSQTDTPLPKITIVGMAANAVTFQDWKMEVVRLSGTVRFIGQTGVELHYTIREGGVIRRTGVIDPPVGGSLIITRDPMEIRIMLPAQPTANTEVEINALGG